MIPLRWLPKLSRNCANWPASNRQLIISQKSYNEFQNSFPKIINSGLDQTNYLTLWEVKDRIKNITEYHTLERVQVQGQLTIFAYEALTEPQHITDELRHQINVLAWCVEMVQSYYLIVDDIEDEAKTRYGKPCWHLLPDVGTLALNDTSMLRSFINEILKFNFNDDMLTKINVLLNEVYLRSEVGQYLDAITSKNRNFSKYDEQLYMTISNNKFTFYSIKFPILVALLLSNKSNAKSIKTVDDAIRNIGYWIQMHNDIMDWYEESSTGKSNTDIKKGNVHG